MNYIKLAETIKKRNLDLSVEKLEQLRNTWICDLKNTQKLKEQKNIIQKQLDIKYNVDLVSQIKQIKINEDKLDKKLSISHSEYTEYLSKFPNIIHDSVPIGNDENNNVIISQSGELPPMVTEHFYVKDILELQHITGARISILKNDFCRLERALINFTMDYLNTCGFIEYSLPCIMPREAFIRSRHLPKDSINMYSCCDDKFLIPTGEVPLVNLFYNLHNIDVPHKICTQTDCYRREAGSAGRDTKGLIRRHVFKKCEMVMACDPDTSFDSLDYMLNISTNIIKQLELPYQIELLCSGDLSFASAKTYDIKVPIDDKWREIASISNTTDYQSQYLKLKNNNKYLHLLNGTALAIGRALASLVSVHRYGDKLYIPLAIRKYINNIEYINLV